MRTRLFIAAIAILGLAFLLHQGFDWLFGYFFELVQYRLNAQGVVWFMSAFMFLTFLMAVMAPVAAFVGVLLKNERAYTTLLGIAVLGGMAFFMATLL